MTTTRELETAIRLSIVAGEAADAAEDAADCYAFATKAYAELRAVVEKVGRAESRAAECMRTAHRLAAQVKALRDELDAVYVKGWAEHAEKIAANG